MLLVGIDWTEAEHAVCLLDGARHRAAPTGWRTPPWRLRAVIAEAEPEPTETDVALEWAHGLLVHQFVEAGYRVYALNPKAVERSRAHTRTAWRFGARGRSRSKLPGKLAPE